MNTMFRKTLISRYFRNWDLKRNKHLLILSIMMITAFSFIQQKSELIEQLTNNTHTVNAAEYQVQDIFIPLAMNRFPLRTVFGIEMLPWDISAGLPETKETNTTWIRYNGLLWSSVENLEGTRNWAVLEDMEKHLMDASADGLQVIMIVRSTPTWAQQLPGAYCGPIKPDKLSAFGDFMYDIVSRYSQPPYNVKYWEIWNEPDVPYTGENGESVWGCWGNTSDSYYGGGYFAEMLKVVYPKIKDADPTAKVVLGGLLLDCDPRPSSNWCAHWNHDERPPKFLEGILLNGGGNYFDGISFHGYDYFDYTDPQLGEYMNAVWGSSWNGNVFKTKLLDRIGPVTKYKLEYLKEILQKYQITGKFLMNTESALICGGTSDPPGGAGCESMDNSLYEQTKARYVPQAYTSALAKDLEANIWFSIFGWRNSGLLYSDQTPRPAYHAYKIAGEELGNAHFVGEDLTNPDVKVYEFQRSNRNIWVVWSIDGNPQNINLPSTPDEVKDFMGVDKTPSSSFTATLEPHYLIWYP